MCRALLPLVSAVLLSFVPGTRGADDEAKAILLKAIKAHGGEETLTRYKASQGKNKGKIKLPELGEVEFTQEVSAMQPDKFKEVMELDIANKKVRVVTIVNGDKASIERNGEEVKLTGGIKAALKEAQYALKAARMVALVKDQGYELATLGEVKVEGKPAVGVRISSKGHKDLNLYFNKETGLLAKVEKRGTNPTDDKEFTEERIILQYGEKTKEGMLVPRKILVKRDGETFMEVEVQEAKFLEKLDDSEFAK
jgi:hypothetical protein